MDGGKGGDRSIASKYLTGSRCECYALLESAGTRVAWMAEVGMEPHDIEAPLRYNRPRSVVEDQDLLDLVRKQLEWERACDEDLRTGT